MLGAQTRSLSFRDARKLLQYGFIANGLDGGDEPPRAPGAAAAPPTRRSSAAIRVRRLVAKPSAASRMPPPRAFLFDAYGTLFDVHSVVEAGRAVTDDPQALSALWRQKQLEYTWLRSLMGQLRGLLGGHRGRALLRAPPARAAAEPGPGRPR